VTEQRSNYPIWAETEHHYTSLFVISNRILIYSLPVCPVRENHRFQSVVVFELTDSDLIPTSRIVVKGQSSLTGFVVYNTRMDYTEINIFNKIKNRFFLVV